MHSPAQRRSAPRLRLLGRGWHAGGRHRQPRGRAPEASTAPSWSASAQLSSPTARRSQVTESVSMTVGGVPRRWVGPGRHCTAAYGGTRTSTARPGAARASSSRVQRTAVATSCGAAASRPQARHACTAAAPTMGSMRRREGMASCSHPERAGRMGPCARERFWAPGGHDKPRRAARRRPHRPGVAAARLVAHRRRPHPSARRGELAVGRRADRRQGGRHVRALPAQPARPVCRGRRHRTDRPVSLAR
jgi:hypothetical protein